MHELVTLHVDEWGISPAVGLVSPLSSDQFFYFCLEDNLDDGRIVFGAGDRNWYCEVGPGLNGQVDVPTIHVGTSHELSNLSDSRCVAVTSTTSMISARCFGL